MPFHQLPPDVMLPGFEMAVASEPFHGETVNGDGLFVETGRVDGGYLMLLVDVTGHGTTTVPTMDVVRKSLRDVKCQNCQPAELLRHLHPVVERDWPATQNFVAALALLFDPRVEEMVAANAGQPDLLLGQPGGAWRSWTLPRNPLLGIPMPGATFRDASASVPVGDWVLAFTDGITEGGAHSGIPQFQLAQLPAFLTNLPAGIGPVEIVNRLTAASRNHVGSNWPDDDVTVVCIHRATTDPAPK